MSFEYELINVPDVNKIDSYRLKIPRVTSVAQLGIHIIETSPSSNFIISVRGEHFTNNRVIMEYRNRKLYRVDHDATNELRKRLCNNVTVCSGHATLEFVADLKEHNALLESMNFLWFKAIYKLRQLKRQMKA